MANGSLSLLSSRKMSRVTGVHFTARFNDEYQGLQ